MAKIRRGRALIPPPRAPLIPLSPDEEHFNANVREIGFGRRRLGAGPRRRSSGASRRHGLSRGAGRTRLPGADARLLRAAAGTAGLLSSAARRVWLSAASARRIRRAALRRGAGAVLRSVLARLRTSLCLWLWALARLSALVKSARRVGQGAKRRAHAFLAASSAWASLRSAHPTKKFRRFRYLG